MLAKIIRGLFAFFLLAAGIYLLIPSIQMWYEGGFQIFTSGEKGKDAFSGILFPIAFIGYGIWEIFNFVKKT